MYIDVLTRVVVSLWEGSGLKVALNQQSHKVDTNVDTISHHSTPAIPCQSKIIVIK